MLKYKKTSKIAAAVTVALVIALGGTLLLNATPSELSEDTTRGGRSQSARDYREYTTRGERRDPVINEDIPEAPKSLFQLNRSNYPFASEEARELVEDFLWQFQSIFRLAEWEDAHSLLTSATHDGTNFRDPDGNLLAATEYGLAVRYNLLDMDGDGIPEVSIWFANALDNTDDSEIVINSVFFRYDNGEFSPIVSHLYDFTADTHVPAMASQGEYTHIFPANTNLMFSSEDGRLILFIWCPRLDIQGDRFVTLNNGVLEIGERPFPFSVIRASEGHG